MKRVVIVDNFDSFTYNIYQYAAAGGGNPVVLKNTVWPEEIVHLNPSHIILSPGPGCVYEPASIGNSLEILHAFEGRIPILGICLGHQIIGMHYGCRIERYRPIAHGQVSRIKRCGRSRMLSGVPREFDGMRYHSWTVANNDPVLKKTLRVSCACAGGLVMGIEHPQLPVYGLQFHPESIGTVYGRRMIGNFISTR